VTHSSRHTERSDPPGRAPRRNPPPTPRAAAGDGNGAVPRPLCPSPTPPRRFPHTPGTSKHPLCVGTGETDTSSDSCSCAGQGGPYYGLAAVRRQSYVGWCGTRDPLDEEGTGFVHSL
jgi:hypothetical protein